MGVLSNKVREDLAKRFVAALEEKQLPWRACWHTGQPINAVNGRVYHGVNAFYLSLVALDKGYQDPRWCTYHQAQENGWQVRKGEKSVRVEYWAYYDTKEKKLLSWEEVRRLLKKDPDYQVNLQLRSRCYNVFNAQQIDGIPELKLRNTDIGELRQKRDALVRNMAVQYRETKEGQAYYNPSADTIVLPEEGMFDDTYSYMATFLHEAGHATGHPDRLNRDMSGSFGSESYAKEELRAEIASAFTAQAIGLRLSERQLEREIRQHSAYIQNWSKHIKDAPEELFRAIRDAEVIFDYLIEKGEFQIELVQACLEEQEHSQAFYGKVVYRSLDGEIASVAYYDDQKAYEQELAYQKKYAFNANDGVQMSYEEFLEDAGKSLLTMGHHMVIGVGLNGCYAAEIKERMTSMCGSVEVHPWMMMENRKVEAVYQWEQGQPTLSEETRSVREDPHTGQLLIEPGKGELLEHRYLTNCCCMSQSEPSVSVPEFCEDELELEP